MTNILLKKFLAALVVVLFVAGASIPVSSGAQAATFLERAQEYFENGDPRSASIELKNALQRDPNNAEARFLLGKVLLQMGDPAAAEKELLRAKELGYASEELDLILAYARLKLQQFDQVVEGLKPEASPSSALQQDIVVARGDALIGLGRLVEAEAAYDHVLKQGPHAMALRGKAHVAMTVGDNDAARGYLDQALSLDPDNPNILYEDAVWLYQNREFKEAQDRFAQAAELDPTRLATYVGLIQSQLQLGKTDEANELVRRLASADPDNLSLTLQDAVVQFMRGNFRDAKTAADRVLAANARVPRALLIAGYSAYQLQQFDQARARLTTYMAMVPADTNARAALGVTLLRLDKAEEAYELVGSKEIALPETAAYLGVLASAAFSAGDRRAGLEYLQQLLAKKPDDYDLQVRLGTVQQALGELGGAIEAFSRARDIDPQRAEAYAKLFSVFMSQQQIEQAGDVAETAVEALPDKPLGNTLLGLASLAADDRESAEAAFRAALDKDPGSATAVSNLANLYMTEGKFDAARQVFEGLLAEHPGNLRGLLAYAQLEERSGALQHAEGLLKQAITGHPDEVVPKLSLGNMLTRAGRPADALQVLTPAVAKHPNSLALREALGNAQLEAGRSADALSSFQALVVKAPSSPRSHLGMMAALERTGRIDEALAAAERALAVDPTNAMAGVSRARLLAHQQRLGEAKDQLAAVRNNYPSLVEVTILEARIALAEQRPQDAVAILTKALEQDDSSVLAYELMRARFAAGQGQEGMNFARRWLDEHPQDIQMLNAVGALLLQSGAFAEAKQRYEAILEAEPANADALNNIAWAQVNLGEEAAAVASARRAVSLAPGNANFLDTLGVALLGADQAGEAVEVLQQAKSKVPDSPTVRFHLARALAEKGDTAGAVAELQGLLQGGRPFAQREAAEALLKQLKG